MLVKEFSSAGIPSDEVLLLPTISLEDIVKSVKEGIKVNQSRRIGEKVDIKICQVYPFKQSFLAWTRTRQQISLNITTTCKKV